MTGSCGGPGGRGTLLMPRRRKAIITMRTMRATRAEAMISGSAIGTMERRAQSNERGFALLYTPSKKEGPGSEIV